VGPKLLQWYSTFDTCTACHDGTVTSTYNVLSGSYQPVDGGSVRPTGGGLFGFEEGGTTTNSLVYLSDNTGGASSLSRHHVEEAGLKLSSAPGGKGSDGSDPQGTWTGTLGCENCHDPHGNGGNPRILNPDPNGVQTQKYYNLLGSNNPYALTRVSTTDPTMGYTVTDPDTNELAKILVDPVRYNLIKVYLGSTLIDSSRVKVVYQDGHSVVTIAGATSTDVFTGYFVLALVVNMDVNNYLTSAETVTYRSGINRFCGTCHTDYDTSNVANSGHVFSGLYSSAARHQVGATVDTAVPGLKFEESGTGTRTLVCLTCHVAHGANQDYWQRTLIDTLNLSNWNSSMLPEISGSSRLKRMPNMGVCEACHQKGYASYSPH